MNDQINRFIVMCIEQYAASINKKSSAVYIVLNRRGIVRELINDYEDMHGMSTELINEYIGKRLGEDINLPDKQFSTKHLLAETLLISDVIVLIASKYKVSINEARDMFYTSDIPNLLDDDETGLYGESALYIFSLFEERNKSK